MGNAKLTAAYRLAMNASTPAVKLWGRLDVEGLERIPASGPVLLVGNHDSYWDTVTVGIAARERRQIRALAKAELWKLPGLGPILDGMGQIPIDRGKGDAGAMERAIELLAEGTCIGVFPEGTRSLGRSLRARSGLGRLAAAVPEAVVVCASVTGTVEIPRFPRRRPRVRVRFFPPEGGPMREGEGAAEFGARLLEEIRREAPVAIAGRRASTLRKRRAAADAQPA